MNNDEFEAFKAVVEAVYKDQLPHWRRGQTVFNVLYSYYPDVADSIRGTDLDPYYNDNRIIKCYEHIKSIL